MNSLHLQKICGELKLQLKQVQAVASLLEEGSTVPFIARYRKEATGTLDEVQITSIRDRISQLEELDKRREAIIKSLEERKLLTPELQEKVAGADTLAVLEDIYLPYRPKKRTRATIAKEKGLEPLAEAILAHQEDPAFDPQAMAGPYVTKEGSAAADDLKVPDVEAALQGARDILAERFNDDAPARAAMRSLFLKKGLVTSKVVTGKETTPDAQKYRDYFATSELLAVIPSHRMLAIRRGAAEEVLTFRIAPPEEEAVAILEALFLHGNTPATDQVRTALRDCYKRLLSLSMETEARLEGKKKADAAAIQVFTQNLRELLLASPLGQKNVLALDPGFRTGCKLVVLDRQGKLLHHDVIYPDQGAGRTADAEQTVRNLCAKYQVEAIAIGNGTAGRETETFIRKLALTAPAAGPDVKGEALAIVMVNESGASIYSASEIAREEFPDEDLTVRGSVSIGRRLMDPLAELVKLDPKSIGVGQYQHDVDQDQLKKSLDDTVVSCVNAVGVEVNTASKQLLTYVSGLNATIADNIVKYRNENGAFKSRRELKKVPRLGEKTFEQAAGFLRIRDGENPLDASAVHPERYSLVDTMAKDLGCQLPDLLSNDTLRQKIEKTKYVSDQVGLPTLNDILSELAKPGRDPRQQFEAFSFKENVSKLEDLTPGMVLPGIVTNVTAFGAFVDVGVHQDGLVHLSQLADRFVKDPNEVVKVQQRVEVTVLEVDLDRKRISLTMKKKPAAAPANRTAPNAGPPAPRSAGPAKPQQAPSRVQVATPPQEGWFTKALRQAGKP